MKKTKSLSSEQIEEMFNEAVALTVIELKYEKGNEKQFVWQLAESCNRMGIPKDGALYHIQSDYNYDDEEVRGLVAAAYSKTDEHGMSRKKGGKGSVNIEVIEAHLKANYSFRYNHITSRLEIATSLSPAGGGRGWTDFTPITDFQINSILRDLMKNRIKCGISGLRNILNSNFCTVYNPFEEYFLNLPLWDGRDYITELADTLTTTNQEYWQRCFKKWLVAMVASAIEPSVINHTVVILCGNQGIGKTTWTEALVPPQLKSYLFSGTINPNNKDTLVHLSECLLINLDELENLNRTEIGSLKEVITKSSIRMRRAYGYNHEYIPRRASFIASVNVSQFLNDTTGSRRFLPFEVLNIKYQHNVPLDKVYAQVLHLYRSGFQFWFDKGEITEITENNEQFQVRSTEEELLLTHFEPGKADEHPLYLSASQILVMLGERSKLTVKTSSAITLGKALKKNGFERVKKKGAFVYPVKLLEYAQVEARNAEPPQNVMDSTPLTMTLGKEGKKKQGF